MILSKPGKKVRRPNPRRSLPAETQVLRTIEKIADAGGLKVGGFFDRRVIEELYQTYTSTAAAGGTDVGQLEELWLSEGGKAFRAKRWYDTSPRFRKYMLLYGVKGDPKTHRPLTIWIGKEMIEAARSSGVPLAKTLHKNLSDRLRRLLGTDSYGFWFNIENSEKAPYALHAHGLLYVRDSRYLVDDSKQRSALIEQLRRASGDHMNPNAPDRAMTPSNWVRITAKELNTGWIDYCRKARRDRLFRISAPEPPKDIGSRLEAGTRNLTQQASDFYGRARLVFRGLASGSIGSWTDAQWLLVTG